jgi:hypothetical protein
LRKDLGSDEVLYGLFGGGIGVVLNLEDILIFLGVVGYLGNVDGATDIFTVLGLTYRTVSAAKARWMESFLQT